MSGGLFKDFKIEFDDKFLLYPDTANFCRVNSIYNRLDTLRLDHNALLGGGFELATGSKLNLQKELYRALEHDQRGEINEAVSCLDQILADKFCILILMWS